MKKLLIFGLLFLAGFLFWRMLNQKSEEAFGPDPGQGIAAQARTLNSRKLSEVAAEPLELDLPLPETRSLSCEAEQRAFMDHSVEQLIEQIRQGTFPPVLLAHIPESQDPCFPPVAGTHFQSCLRMREQAGNARALADCRIYLTFARALQVAALTTDWDHYDSMNLGVLVNQILAKILRSQEITPTERQQWRKMTEALMERQPESLEALKAHLMSFITDPELKALEPDGEVSAWLEKGLELSPHDPQLLELQLFVDSQQADGRNRLQTRLEQEPDSALGYYYLASQDWRAGDRSTSIRNLRRAIELDPSQKRFKESLRKARNPRTSFEENIFVLQLGVSFDQI